MTAIPLHPGLENYTFLTLCTEIKESDPYGVSTVAILAGFQTALRSRCGRTLVCGVDRKDYGMNSGIPFIRIADRVEVDVALKWKRVSGPPLVFNQ